MTSKEYKVILDCSYMNLCEEPRLPPSFRGDKPGSMDAVRLLVDKVNINSQILLSRTVTIFTVAIENALFEMYNGIHDDSPLAHVAVSVCISCFLSNFVHFYFFASHLGGCDLFFHIAARWPLGIVSDDVIV